MLTGNVFWPLVEELYPWFLIYCAVQGVIRMGRGVLGKLNGENDTIGDAMNDIIISFFFAHINVALVALIWYLASAFSRSANKVVETIGEGILNNGGR